MATHAEEPDDPEALLVQIANRSFELGNTNPPYWLEVAFQTILTDIHGPWIPAREKAHPGKDAFSMTYSAARLGFAARRAECEILRQPEVNRDVEAVIRDGFGQGIGEDWFAVVCNTASSLMYAADHYPERVPTNAALAPLGIGHANRRRLGGMTVDHILYDEDGTRLHLGSVSVAAIVECWRFGYYLSACNASLPPSAAEELGAAEPMRGQQPPL